MTKRPAARRCPKLPPGGDNGCDDIKVPGPDLDMEDGERVLIYNGAMRVEVLCARRDCANAGIGRTAAQKTIWLYADTSACPLWTPTRSAAKRFGAELADGK